MLLAERTSCLLLRSAIDSRQPALEDFEATCLPGEDIKSSAFCASCYYYNSKQALEKGRNPLGENGWYSHCRSMCNYKNSCPLKEDTELFIMSDSELCEHLREHGLLEGPARSVEGTATGEEPEKKRRKRKRKRRMKERKGLKPATARPRLSSMGTCSTGSIVFRQGTP